MRVEPAAGWVSWRIAVAPTLATKCRTPVPTATAFHWLASFLERADPNVVAVVVIGSAARPNVASDDLDLMILCRDAKSLKEKAPIEVDIRKANIDGVEMDIRSS